MVRLWHHSRILSPLLHNPLLATSTIDQIPIRVPENSMVTIHSISTKDIRMFVPFLDSHKILETFVRSNSSSRSFLPSIVHPPNPHVLLLTSWSIQKITQNSSWRSKICRRSYCHNVVVVVFLFRETYTTLHSIQSFHEWWAKRWWLIPSFHKTTAVLPSLLCKVFIVANAFCLFRPSFRPYPVGIKSEINESIQ